MKPFVHCFAVLFAALATISPNALALTYQRSDSLTVVGLLQKGARQPSNDNLMLFYAQALVGKPYVGQTLEVNPKEELAVNLRELDCTTLVENVVALTLTTHQSSTRFSDFCANLQRIRYHNGKLDGYASRNHYFSEWIASNESMGIVSEVKGKNKDSRGAFYPFVEAQTLACTYMSTHPDRYPMLKDDKAALRLIKENERRINGRTVRYVPRRLLDKSRKELGSIQDGDILAIKNLDGLAWDYVEVVVGIDIRHGGTANTDVTRFVVIDEQLDEFLGVAPVRRQTDRHTREGAQHGNVVQRVVGGTKCSVGHTARNTKNGDRILRIGQIDFDLFQ